VGNFELLEGRLLLSATSDTFAAFRLQIATGLAAYHQTLAMDRQIVANDLASVASGDPSLVAQLKSDLAAFASKFKADQQALLTTRTADLSSLRADQGSPDALAADRLRLQTDFLNLLATLKQDQADREAARKQDRAAIAASKADARNLLQQDLEKMAGDRANAAQQIALDLQELRNTMSGGGLDTGSSDAGTVTGSMVSVEPPPAPINTDLGSAAGGTGATSGGLTYVPVSGNDGGGVYISGG
jgi:hypothetical protein